MTPRRTLPPDDLTLRDVMAMAALVGMCLPYSGSQSRGGYLQAARDAYKYADSMLSVRSERPPEVFEG